MPRLTSWLPFTLIILLAAACGDDPPADLNGPPDSGTAADAASNDANPSDAPLTDNGRPDALDSDGSAPDTGLTQDGSVSDADGSGDGSSSGDGSTSDADAGAGTNDGSSSDADVSGLRDEDSDFISDADEGNGLVDTDSDGTPDNRDSDSDNDGINDSVEAGDARLDTPPIDTDGDGTPDFRDLDADQDSIPDGREGAADVDQDGVPNYRDDDSDGDGISDAAEGESDPDGDQIPSFLDDDSDGDGIPDRIEGVLDPDADGRPNYLDDDSDADGLTDGIEGVADPDNDGTPAFLDLDSDGDGIGDNIEGSADPDADGLGNWLDTDSDGDTIADVQETIADSDSDGTPNYLDVDSDGDGVNDRLEAGDENQTTSAIDTDFDGVPNFLDLDSDADFLSDTIEGTQDTDGDTIPDMLDVDSDGDSVLDIDEAGDSNLTTAPLDSDGDGIYDFRDLDSDGDTISDADERTADTDRDGTPDLRDTDSDGDGHLDRNEVTDTNVATIPDDTDNDGTPDFRDLDSDADGLADAIELGCPSSTSRRAADSDGDGFLDPAERVYGSNPCSSSSGIDDFYFELPPLGPRRTAPLVFENTEIDQADFAINIDTTSSMDEEIANLQSTLSNLIIPGVDQAIPDAAFAVTSFQDYPIGPFGGLDPETSQPDIPFVLGTRVTSNAAVAQNALNALVTGNGGDVAEAGIQSLFMIATGQATTWPGGSVPAFDPAQNRVPGVADGTIGGVGFRSGSLPVIVQVTDAPSHEQAEYHRVDTNIGAIDTPTARTAITSLGARIITVANQRLPRAPETATLATRVADQCSKTAGAFLGRIDGPATSLDTDVDWFELTGASSGDVVRVETFASRLGSTLDTMVGVFNSAGTRLAINDDIQTEVILDSNLTVTLSGPAPYYVAITSYNNVTFGVATFVDETFGFYFLDVTVDAVPYTRSSADCSSTDEGDSRSAATPLVPIGSASPAVDPAACATSCESTFDFFHLPYAMARETRASVPPCSWDEFGAGRPAACGPLECCTGVSGQGVAPAADGLCPLAFQVEDDGVGVGESVLAGIEALVNFAAFTITTVARPDPVELANSGLDTTCFIHGVIPLSATPPSTCAPTPVAADLRPPSPELDSFTGVVPGTVLTFQVRARNQNLASPGSACRNATPDPQLYRAFIDVVADGVTVVDTRDVIIIVPPQAPDEAP